MIKELNGRIKNERCGVAGRRLVSCAQILKKYGITFPPLYPGTINIKLSEYFASPKKNLIFISQREIDSVAPGYCEWWTFIKVKNINGNGLDGLIYRTQQNPHGNDSAELITVDLRNDNRFSLKPGEYMSFEVDDE